MNYHSTPIDAPHWHTTKARYIDTNNRTRSSRSRKETVKSRYHVFSVGRSQRNYEYKDPLFDDIAMGVLEHTKLAKQRLAIKGYQSTTGGPTTFNILTHIAVYVKHGEGFATYNPVTGEQGYYELTSNLRNVTQTVPFH